MAFLKKEYLQNNTKKYTIATTRNNHEIFAQIADLGEVPGISSLNLELVF